MRIVVSALLLLVPACAPELPPEQVAARRAEALVKPALAGSGRGDGTILAPIAGIDDRGRAGVCGLVETPAGPIRVVVDLAGATFRTGVTAAQGGHRLDVGESRFCSDAARRRWEQVKKVDPVGLMARIDGSGG
jgi:hypothetical protein